MEIGQMGQGSFDALQRLRVPFPQNQISYIPKGGVKLAYVGHAALTDRLLDTDIVWSWEPLSMSPEGLPVMDGFGGMWIKLTVCGVTRLGYGHAGDKEGGDAIKEVIGDAMRNAAMRFGAALDLWHKGDLHGEDPLMWDRTKVMKVTNSIREHLVQGREMGALQEWEIARDSDELFSKAVWAGLTTPERDKLRELANAAEEAEKKLSAKK